MKQEVFIYTYQTKNLINGKTYIGVHKTKNLDDGYIGCDIYREPTDSMLISVFPRAVKKHGYKNFHKEILCFFDTIEEAYEEEAFLVDKKWVESKDNYNIALGGNGGWHHINRNKEKYTKRGKDHHRYGIKHTEEVIERLRELNTGKKASEESKRKMSIAKTNENNAGENHPMWGKPHTAETKKILSEAGILRSQDPKEKHKLIKHFKSVKQVQNLQTQEIFVCMKDAAKDADIEYREFIKLLKEDKLEKYNIINK